MSSRRPPSVSVFALLVLLAGLVAGVYLVGQRTFLSSHAAGIPGTCKNFDNNLNGCNHTSGCAYYSCSNQCWNTGTPLIIACPTICRNFNNNLNGCNHTSGCAYYSCSNQCWPMGTSLQTAGCSTKY